MGYYNDDYMDEPPLCRKCWDEYTHCGCDIARAKQEAEDAKKELKAEKARTAAVLKAYKDWHTGSCTCEPAYCPHLSPLRSALEDLRLGMPPKKAKKSK